ncbi:hypothetical protein KQX54_018414 [Cotesia glomerata]|uniref:Uncharacterized protein n=1 Tax=Cotesia glomerata TaxID=32391 RepID=A0AAV7I438_COTGL|nr:hypothetical protein KQX54_018414 [Cotesia glomerata]
MMKGSVVFPIIDESEKRELKPQLIKYLQNPDSYNEIIFFKVRITTVICTINPHEVYFIEEIAFIPFYKMKQALCN